MQTLFDGLNNFPTSDLPVNFLGIPPPDFPTSYVPAAAGGFTDVSPPLVPGVQEPSSFATQQVYATVDDLRMYGLPGWHSHIGPSSHRVANHPPQPPTPVDQSATLPSPLFRRATEPRLMSRTGTPVKAFRSSSSASSTHRAPHLSTRNMTAQTRVRVQSPDPTSSIYPERESVSVSPPPHPYLRRYPPLRRSLELPSFLGDNNNAGTSLSDKEHQSDPDRSRSSTPVALEDTDISLHESSPRPVTQSRLRAVRYFNVRVLPRHANPDLFSIPTIQHLRTNALNIYKACGRRKRVRKSTATGSRGRNILSSGELTSDQRAVMPQMEFHVLKNLVCVNPWPELEDRESFLSDAERYATRLTNVAGNNVFTERFFNTVSAHIHYQY
jgi:hypothetical protein